MNRKKLCIGNKTSALPLIQGGMGVGISLSGLAGAVAKEGGIGIISTAQIGFRDPDFQTDSKKANLHAMVTELQKARILAAKTDGSCNGLLGYNIMVATRDYGDYVRTAAAAGADVIISGAGLPVDMPKYVEGTDTKIVTRYYEQDTWKKDLIFEKESFDLLQNILQEAGELPAWTPYEDIVNTEFATKAAR